MKKLEQCKKLLVFYKICYNHFQEMKMILELPTGSKLITGPDGRQYDENFIKTIPGGFNNMQEIERRRKILRVCK